MCFVCGKSIGHKDCLVFVGRIDMIVSGLVYTKGIVGKMVVVDKEVKMGFAIGVEVIDKMMLVDE